MDIIIGKVYSSMKGIGVKGMSHDKNVGQTIPVLIDRSLRKCLQGHFSIFVQLSFSNLHKTIQRDIIGKNVELFIIICHIDICFTAAEDCFV
jgi:hypothetical protein